jgi:N-acetylglutamate synthase-like GNAT family acetyltransferase
MLEVVPLSTRPDFAEICASWSYGSWGCHTPDASIYKSIENYKERAANKDQLPSTWVACENQKCAGMASLVECDNEERKDLFPWLASVFVHPDFRKRGIASMLVQHIYGEAKKQGYKNLYLFTPDAEKLYEKNGWRIIGKIGDPRGIRDHEHLMEIEL